MHVGQATLDAVVVVAQALVIESEQVQERGVEIVNGRDILHRLVAELIRGSVAETALYARAREPDGEPLRVVARPVAPF